ncbi:MAG: hypothetical protein V1824_04655 [archaeon]
MSDDIVKDAVDSTVRWSLDEAKKNISDWIYKFKNKKLLFLQNKEDITKINAIDKSKEQQAIKTYIKDKDILLLAKLGFLLREKEKDNQEIGNIRKKIIKRFNISGLHIACFFQNGLFNIYFKEIIESNKSNEIITKEIESIIQKIEDISLFVTKDDNTDRIVDVIKTRLYVKPSYSYLILSYNTDAMKICESIKNKLSKIIGNKNLQITEYNDSKRLIFMFRLKTCIE